MNFLKYVFLVAGILFICVGIDLGIEFEVGASLFSSSMGILLLVASYRRFKQEKDTEERKSIADYMTMEIDGISQEDGALLQESYTKAVNDFNYLEDARKNVQEPGLHAQLDKMQDIARNLLEYLQAHPEKISLARRFVDYYQDRSVVLVKKYFELEKTNLQTQEVQDTKQRIRTMLFSMDEAYSEQFNKLLNEQLMDMDAELKVMEQTIEADGIAVDAPEPPAETAKKVQDAAGFQPAAPQEGLVWEGNPPVLVNRGGRHMRQHKNPGNGWIVPYDRSNAIRQKLIAGALAICLGSFGAHKFFMGKTKTGIVYALFCWTGLPALVGFVEGIRYIVMPAEDFFHQYMEPRA